MQPTPSYINIAQQLFALNETRGCTSPPRCVQGFFATASITFCDQASWQSRIAAKPTQGVLGFFAATYIWFAIPSTIGTSVGFAYLDHTAGGANQSLSTEAIDSGICEPERRHLSV